jgi:beta-glucanase (GH16 family)
VTVGVAIAGLLAIAPAAFRSTRLPFTASAAGASSEVPCGGSMPKYDGGLWQCTFDDEFSGSSLDRSKWAVLTTSSIGVVSGPSGYQTCYVDSPNNVSVAAGTLRLTVRKESKPFTCGNRSRSFTTQYTSAEVSTLFSLQQQYGRFAVRAKLPQVTAKGLQESLWLWPSNSMKYGPWPMSGEIDFAEFYSRYHDLAIPYIHYWYDSDTTDQKTDTNVVTAYDCTIDFTGFNRYVLVWQPGWIAIRVNGDDCVVDRYRANAVPPPAPFDQPFFMALTQALGVDGNAFDPAVTPLPATTQIDYVRVWK